MKQKPQFSAEKARELFDYNPETGDLTWRASTKGRRVRGNIAGYIFESEKNGYRVVGVDRRLYPAHRVIWLIVYGYWPAQIDHINGKRADNRLCNLRESTQTENTWNKPGHGRSGVKGVSYNRKGDMWRARIMHHGKSRHLGDFRTKDEAGFAYERAARSLHGEFANAKHMEDA
jgi:hypothetical protein